MGRNTNDALYHVVAQPENQDIIDLERRLAILEQKPDVVFLRTMRERLGTLENQVKQLQSKDKPTGGAWG